MTMGVNPLIASLGGGTATAAPSTAPTGGPGAFANLVTTPAAEGTVPEAGAETAAARGGLIQRLDAAMRKLAELDLSIEIDLSNLTAEDFAKILSGDFSALEALGLSTGEAEALGAALAELADVLVDLQSVFGAEPALEQIFEVEDLTETEEGVALAGLIEALQPLRQAVVSGLLVPAQDAPAKANALPSTAGESRPLQSLSLLTEVDGLSIPEQPLQDIANLNPAIKSVLREIVMGAGQAVDMAIEFRSSETPLVLSATGDRPAIQSVEEPHQVTPQQKPDAQISAKFANAIVSQVKSADFQEGTTRVELSPRGLGTVEVEMRTKSDGTLAVVVRAENPAVLNSLREERDLLAEIISQDSAGTLEFQEYERDGNSNDQSPDGFGAVEQGEGDGSDALEDAAEVNTVIEGETLDLVA